MTETLRIQTNDYQTTHHDRHCLCVVLPEGSSSSSSSAAATAVERQGKLAEQLPNSHRRRFGAVETITTSLYGTTLLSRVLQTD